jgi:hypothetical protein
VKHRVRGVSGATRRLGAHRRRSQLEQPLRDLQQLGPLVRILVGQFNADRRACPVSRRFTHPVFVSAVLLRLTPRFDSLYSTLPIGKYDFLNMSDGDNTPLQICRAANCHW